MQPSSPKIAEVHGSAAHADGSGATAKPALGQLTVDRIGNTPLLRLVRIATDLPGVEILGKAEWLNPGGSIKDRAARHTWREPRAGGKLTSDKILLDSTSGNTGIAYAMIGAAQGFPVTLCMPENVSVERKRILHAYGANIIYTDPGDGSDGAIRMARELAAKHPESVLLRRPVFQRRQLAGSLPWHSQRNLATDGRTYHALCGDARHQWNFRWNDTAA